MSLGNTRCKRCKDNSLQLLKNKVEGKKHKKTFLKKGGGNLVSYKLVLRQFTLSIAYKQIQNILHVGPLNLLTHRMNPKKLSTNECKTTVNDLLLNASLLQSLNGINSQTVICNI